jgi:hypothetical protein
MLATLLIGLALWQWALYIGLPILIIVLLVVRKMQNN